MNSLAIVERFGGVLAPEMRFSMLPPSPGWPSHHRAGGERSWSLCACSGETGADCRRGDDGDYSAYGDYGGGEEIGGPCQRRSRCRCQRRFLLYCYAKMQRRFQNGAVMEAVIAVMQKHPFLSQRSS
jgi:hypothetical protein